MDENKTIDIILILVFVFGIASLGLFFFSGEKKYPSEDPTTHIRQGRLNPKPSKDTSKENSLVTKPLVPENKQIGTTTELSESSTPDGIEQIDKTTNIKEDIPILETDLPKKETVTVSQNVIEEDLVKKKKELEDQNEQITFETKKVNGTIATAQEIPEGTVSGKKQDVKDRADLFKIRAKGEKMSLILKPELKTIKDRSVMTIYNNQLKIIGEYFPYNGSKRHYSVREGEVYYIKLNLSSTEKPSFDYRLKIEFQNSSLN